VIVRDLSERQEATLALRRSEERFAKIFHASPAAITISRVADGRFLDVNEQFLTLTGRTRRELARRLVELRPWVPVLFMSGYPGERGGPADLGDAPLLQKPFSAAALRGRVRELLDAASAEAPHP
jgi:PAS domain-containing protein